MTTTDHDVAKLSTTDGSYKQGLLVTTAPAGEELDGATVMSTPRRGNPCHVDPERFAAWSKAGFFEAEPEPEPETGPEIESEPAADGGEGEDHVDQEEAHHG